MPNAKFLLKLVLAIKHIFTALLQTEILSKNPVSDVRFCTLGLPASVAQWVDRVIPRSLTMVLIAPRLALGFSE